MKRMFTKSKTKADILSMLDRMIAQHGDAMSIPMLLSLIHISSPRVPRTSSWRTPFWTR